MKVPFRFGKIFNLMSVMIYETTWVTVVLQISHTCCKFQPSASSSCFKQYFPFLLGGENIQNHFIKSTASSHYFTKAITSSSCVEDTPGDTLFNTFVHDKYSPARLVSQNLRPKSILLFQLKSSLPFSLFLFV